jgi:hypothetical protein
MYSPLRLHGVFCNRAEAENRKQIPKTSPKNQSLNYFFKDKLLNEILPCLEYLKLKFDQMPSMREENTKTEYNLG